MIYRAIAVVFILSLGFNLFGIGTAPAFTPVAVLDVHDTGNEVLGMLPSVKGMTDHAREGLKALFAKPFRIVIVSSYYRTFPITVSEAEINQTTLDSLGLVRIKLGQKQAYMNRLTSELYTMGRKDKEFLENELIKIPELMDYRNPSKGCIGEGHLTDSFREVLKISDYEYLVEQGKNAVDNICFENLYRYSSLCEKIRIPDNRDASGFIKLSCPEDGSYAWQKDGSGKKNFSCTKHGTLEDLKKTKGTIYSSKKSLYSKLEAISGVFKEVLGIGIVLKKEKNSLVLGISAKINEESLLRKLNDDPNLKEFLPFYQDRCGEMKIGKWIPADSAASFIVALPELSKEMLWKMHLGVSSEWNRMTRKDFDVQLDLFDRNFTKIAGISFLEGFLPALDREFVWIDYPSEYSHFGMIPSGIAMVRLKDPEKIENLLTTLSAYLETLQIKAVEKEYAGYRYYRYSQDSRDTNWQRRSLLPWPELCAAVVEGNLVVATSSKALFGIMKVAVGEKESLLSRKNLRHFRMLYDIHDLRQYTWQELWESVTEQKYGLAVVLDSGKDSINARVILDKGVE